MPNIDAIHVVPADRGGWVVQAGEGEVAGVEPTQGEAIVKAWEMTRGRVFAEVIVHASDGAIDCNITIRRPSGRDDTGDVIARDDDPDEAAIYREALRISPSREDLRKLIRRLPPSAIDYSLEDPELPC